MKKIVGVIIIGCFLIGCNESGINLVKNQKLSISNNYTIGQILDNRAVCNDIEWIENKENKSVLYTCSLGKGKRYFSFDESYAKKLRGDTYKYKIEFYTQKKNEEIEFDKEKIIELRKEIKYLENINAINDDFFAKYRNVKIKKTMDDFISSKEELDKIDNEFENKLIDYLDFNIGLNRGELSDMSQFSYINTSKNIHFFILLNEYLSSNKNKNNEEVNSFIQHMELKKRKCIAGKMPEQCEYKLKENRIYNSCDDFDDKYANAECLKDENEFLSGLSVLLNEFNELLNEHFKSYVSNLINYDNNRINEINNDISYLKSKEKDEENKKLSENDAERAVKKYSLFNIMYGKEFIFWEYNDIKKEYILKKSWMTQYEYGGSETNFNLDLEKIIYSSLNNINNIDEYMNLRTQDAIRKLNELLYKYSH